MENLEEFISSCHQGNIDRAEELLPLVNINGANKIGQGALLTFFPRVTNFLLKNGANPNLHFNENGATVLAGLSHVRKPECVRLLLENGADPDKGRKKSGETPLHHVFAEDYEIVALLLEAGADPNKKAKKGVVSFNYGGDVQVRGETPFHRAAAYGSVKIIDKFLQSGAKNNIKDANGDTPLSWALLHRRNKEVLQMFF